MSRSRAAISAAALLLALGFASPARAMPIYDAPPSAISSSETFVSPSTEPYSSVSGIVGEIRVHERNVFDLDLPGEDWWGFRIANEIHVMTNPDVIEREVLLVPGEPYDPLETLESERNLRAERFIRTAEIHPTQDGKGKVDLDVDTQDSWTTLPEFSAGTEGGDSYFIYGAEENNLFGYGKSVSLYHAQVGSLIRNEARYVDPRLDGSRVNLVALGATTNQGNEVGLDVGRPFFSTETPYSWNVLPARIVQQDNLYQDAQQSNQFLQNFDGASSMAAFKIADTETVQRVSVGTLYERDEFTATSETTGPLPDNRTLSGPQIGYSLVQPDYVKETYINSMSRVEDFNMGNEFSAVAGSMMKAFGSDEDRWTLSAQDQQGVHFTEGRFALAQAGVQGRIEDGTPQNGIFYASGNLFWKTEEVIPQTLVGHLEWNTTRNLDGEKQLLLGGDTGLRGYRNYSFTGTRSVLLNFEDRTFLTQDFFHLFYAGGVAFFDTGSVSGEGFQITWPNLKSDVGLGLRFSPSRSTTGDVVRMDLAYALNSGPGSRWVVSIRGGQAFDIFNSTNREVLHTPSDTISDDSAGDRLRQR